MTEQQKENPNLPVIQEAQAMVVTNSDQNTKAVEKCKSIRELIKKITDHHEPGVVTARKAWKTALETRDNLTKPLLAAEAELKDKISAFFKAEKRRMQIEAQRQADEEAEAERQRLDKIAKMQARAGKKADAEETQQVAEELELEVVPVAKPVVSAGQSMRKKFTVAIAEEGNVPRAYCSPDMQKIKAAVNAAGGNIIIAGVIIEEDYTAVIGK